MSPLVIRAKAGTSAGDERRPFSPHGTPAFAGVTEES